MVDSVGTLEEGFKKRTNYSVSDFQMLIKLLCGPDGCPWDREQTHESIRRNLLEEAYEAAEAIDNNDKQGLIEELGDVLMQVLFHADMAERAGEFDLSDITNVACKKLIRRHPHVFGEDKAKDGVESLNFWDNIKREEKSHDTTFEAMQSVARSLPELWRADKIQKKAAKAGFDWPTYEGALDTLKSELGELEEAIAGARDTAGTYEAISEEIGDLLFSVVNMARFFDVDPEKALEATNDKFISRFRKLELEVNAQGKVFKDMTLDEMESIYQQVKLEE
jgi:tetrapyrrole methylase family protein/MazG family protein